MTGGELTQQRVQITVCHCAFSLHCGFFWRKGVALELPIVVKAVCTNCLTLRQTLMKHTGSFEWASILNQNCLMDDRLTS